MRISTGEHRGRVLRTPKGEATRPTSGMVRESLFNMLAREVSDARVLDLYAGCGSVGLEALSRGAAHVTFVEKARSALACLYANIEGLGVGARIAVMPIPVERALDVLARQGESFDLIFLDPPFTEVTAYQRVLETVAISVLLAPGGRLVAQHDIRLLLPEQIGTLACYRQQKLGDNALSLYARNAD